MKLVETRAPAGQEEPSAPWRAPGRLDRGRNPPRGPNAAPTIPGVIGTSRPSPQPGAGEASDHALLTVPPAPREGPGLRSPAVGRLPWESPALLSPPPPGAAAPHPSLCLLSSTSGLVSIWGPGELVRAAKDSGKPETTGEH